MTWNKRVYLENRVVKLEQERDDLRALTAAMHTLCLRAKMMLILINEHGMNREMRPEVMRTIQDLERLTRDN